MNEISLNLSVDEVNAVLSALGQMPFVQVVNLVGKIKTQAEEQLKGAPQSAE